jgi:hypothetical protein
VVTEDSPRPGVTIAVPEAIDPANAPVPRNSSERLIFRQLYQTLVGMDCQGRAVPDLAVSWEADDSGRVWHFRIRRAASFSDGTPVTAPAVAESWTANPAAARAAELFVAVDAIDLETLQVELRAATLDPRIFSHPGLAVARRTAQSGWPSGTGRFAAGPATDPRVVQLVSRDRTQTLELRSADGADLRRALDTGPDALIATDAATLDYARAREDYSITPLDWSLVYGLVTRAESATLPVASQPPNQVLAELAKDAVRADARPSQPPFWFQNPKCLNDVSAQEPAAATTRERTIAYARDDAIARDIAERIAALAWPAARVPPWLRALLPAEYGSGGAPAVRELSAREVLDWLRARRGIALVVALPRINADICASAVVADPAVNAIMNTPGLRFTPLIDARGYLVHRPGLGRVLLDGDGTLRFTGGGA